MSENEKDDVRRFENADLRGARFRNCDLSGAVLRSVELDGAEIDTPWLFGGTFFVNGVDVVPLVAAELERRFPGRGLQRAADPAGLHEAWAALDSAWAAARSRAEAMPAGTVDVSVDGEWSFAQSIRHIVFAIDTWLGLAILRLDQPYHPLGVTNAEAAEEGFDMSLLAEGQPEYAEVLEAWSGRADMVQAYIAAVSSDELAEARANPWAPQHDETVLSCLHTILEEGWEHLRFATRDLDAIETRAG